MSVAAALLPAALAGALSAEAGAEYDSNATRLEQKGDAVDTPIGAPLLRTVATGDLRHQAGRHRLHLRLTGGGKVFLLPEAMSQTIFVVNLFAEEGAVFRRSKLALFGDYYESFQAGDPARDSRSVTAGARLASGRALREIHRVEGGLDLTGNLFLYKPDHVYDFLAPSAVFRTLVRLHQGDLELGHDFELGLHGRVDYRFYPSDLRFNDPDRRDLFAQIGGTFAWLGPVTLQAGYTLQLNFSNKEPMPNTSTPPESYQRHVVIGKFGARLPLDFYLTLKGQLNFLLAAPSGFVPMTTVDEENRSVVMVDLERPLPKGWAISARYSGYFNLLFTGSTERPYQRHTVYLGCTYRFQTR